MAAGDTGSPLNPMLYRRIQERIGPVTVANAGYEAVPMPYGVDRDGSPIMRYKEGEYYRVCCPFCGDTKKRLWISYLYGQPDPSSGGRLTWLATCYNETECLSDPDNRRILARNLLGFQNRYSRPPAFPLKQGEKPPEHLSAQEPPGELQFVGQLESQHVACRYLRQRGFDPVYLEQAYRVAYLVRPKPQFKRLAGRLIIPVFLDDVCVGWQARIIGDPSTMSNKIPKYESAPGFRKSLALYNYDVAKNYPFIVVTEGAMDVWATGPYAVATFGTSLSARQQSMLQRENRDKPIVWMWDPGAWDKSGRYLQQIRSQGTNPVVECVLPAGTDPGDYDPQRNIEFIRQAAATAGVDLGYE